MKAYSPDYITFDIMADELEVEYEKKLIAQIKKIRK